MVFLSEQSLSGEAGVWLARMCCLFCPSSIWYPDPILAQQIQELVTYKSSAICFANSASAELSCLAVSASLGVNGLAFGFQLRLS